MRGTQCYVLLDIDYKVLTASEASDELTKQATRRSRLVTSHPEEAGYRFLAGASIQEHGTTGETLYRSSPRRECSGPKARGTVTVDTVGKVR